MLNYFPDAMQFLRYLLGVLYELAGFQNNIKRKFKRNDAKHQILLMLTLQYDVKFFNVYQCGKQIRTINLISCNSNETVSFRLSRHSEKLLLALVNS